MCDPSFLLAVVSIQDASREGFPFLGVKAGVRVLMSPKAQTTHFTESAKRRACSPIVFWSQVVKVSVVAIEAKSIEEFALELREGATVAEAIAAAGLSYNDSDSVALWGRRVTWETVLEDGARVELARALICDPKKVRREHAEAQGDIRVVTKGRHGGKRRQAAETADAAEAPLIGEKAK